MNTERELRPCPWCNGAAQPPIYSLGRWFCRCTRCGTSGPSFSHGGPHAGEAEISAAKDQAIIAWNRRSSDEQAEVVESREVLFFASYCGGDNHACTPARPCADCIAMGNVYSIPADTRVLFQREFGASPPAVAAGGVTEALDAAREWINASGHAEHCFTNDPNPDACRCVCGKDSLIELIDDAVAALAVGDEGIREGEAR